MKRNDAPIVVKETYLASVKAVWNAITNAEEMRRWYFNTIPEFDPKVGFEVVFDVVSGERTFPHRRKVIKVMPLQKIEYDWSHDGYPGAAVVSFDLTKEGTATALTVTCKIVQDFADNIPEFARESCLAGWQYFINKSLKGFLENY